MISRPMSNIDKQALRNLAVAAKLTPSWYAVGEFGDVVDPAKPEWKPVHEFCKTFTAARVLALLDELEAKDKRIAELEALAPELKMAHLINKFYERYPLAEFKSDTDRSAALGYFIAGAELQCFGEFINYAELMGDE